MLANKLEEMKKRLLLQTQLKKENNEGIVSLPLAEEPPAQVEAPPEIASLSNKSKQDELEEDQIESPDESNSAEKASENGQRIEQQLKEEGNVDLDPHNHKKQVIIEEEGEVNEEEGDRIIEKEDENQLQLQEKEVQKQQKGVENQQNLEFGRDQNAFMSIDEQVRQVMTEKINEIQKEAGAEQSKVQKKSKKIVIKELVKVKECIKNLQSVVIGLEYIQERVRYYPSLKEKLGKHIRQLKQLNKQ